MAGELQVAHTASAATIYALIKDGTGRVWDVAGANFEAYLTAQVGNYDVVMTEEGTASQYYLGIFPATIAAGSYRVTYHVQAVTSRGRHQNSDRVGRVVWVGDSSSRGMGANGCRPCGVLADMEGTH